VIGDRFVKKCGQTEREREETSMTETATIEDFEGTKYVGLFFSADWCPPCKQMLRPLKNFYTDVNLQERTLEIILISSDREQDEWKRHHATMPWMTLPWGDARANALRSKFEIYGVPALIILDSQTGFTITTKGRKDLTADVTEVYQSWAKLVELKKVRAVERAEQDAIAQA
jgi:nucleoredoxin